jgi:hypothetical protein
MFGTLIYKGVKLERGGRLVWTDPVANTHTPLFPTLTPVFICPSSTQYTKETILRWKIYWGDICPHCPPPPRMLLLLKWKTFVCFPQPFQVNEGMVELWKVMATSPPVLSYHLALCHQTKSSRIQSVRTDTREIKKKKNCFYSKCSSLTATCVWYLSNICMNSHWRYSK